MYKELSAKKGQVTHVPIKCLVSSPVCQVLHKYQGNVKERHAVFVCGGRLLLFWFCLYRSGENFIFFVVKKLRWSKHLNLLHPVRPSVILSLHPLTWPRRPQLPWFPEPDGPPASWISPAPVRGSPSHPPPSRHDLFLMDTEPCT